MVNTFDKKLRPNAVRSALVVCPPLLGERKGRLPLETRQFVATEEGAGHVTLGCFDLQADLLAIFIFVVVHDRGGYVVVHCYAKKCEKDENANGYRRRKYPIATGLLINGHSTLLKVQFQTRKLYHVLTICARPV